MALTVSLPDGSERELPDGANAADLAAAVGPRLAADAVIAVVDGEERDLHRPLPDGARVEIVVAGSPAGLHTIRHSTAHVLAQAVLDLFPGATHAIGPPTENGFFYDFELPDGAGFSDGDLERIEARMREIVAADQPFVRAEIGAVEALDLFEGHRFKQEIISSVALGAGGSGSGDAADDADEAGTGSRSDGSMTAAAGSGDAAGGIGRAGTAAGDDEDDEMAAEAAGDGTVSYYRNGDGFIDLCRGPHVASTGKLGHFALQRSSGAYWRGSEKNPMLQRVHGTAWATAKDLKAHLQQLAEAAKRDHRRLAAELDLVSWPPELGPGLAVWHPKGALVRKVMEDYSRARHEQGGYQFVFSPHLAKSVLWETSGHLDYFADSMYPPMEMDGADYYPKPMNCPFHVMVYRSGQRSYRDLPIRLFELGTVYRYERSGVVHGLLRSRGFTQDDSHIFCAREQVAGELASLLDFVLSVLRAFGFEDFEAKLSTRPAEKWVGSEELWDEATDGLRAALDEAGLDYGVDVGGGAFYGPKIDVDVRDAIGRSWQLSTIQLDFNLPERFALDYAAADGSRPRPVMIHRALFGSVERFFGVLLEHYAGAFPAWLAPVQAVVLPVAEDHHPYAASVAEGLRAEGFRVEVSPAVEPLGKRVRTAKVAKLPYVLVVGGDDAASGTVGVNPRGGGSPERGVAVADFAARLAAEVRDRA